MSSNLLKCMTLSVVYIGIMASFAVHYNHIFFHSDAVYTYSVAKGADVSENVYKDEAISARHQIQKLPYRDLETIFRTHMFDVRQNYQYQYPIPFYVLSQFIKYIPYEVAYDGDDIDFTLQKINFLYCLSFLFTSFLAAFIFSYVLLYKIRSREICLAVSVAFLAQSCLYFLQFSEGLNVHGGSRIFGQESSIDFLRFVIKLLFGSVPKNLDMYAPSSRSSIIFIASAIFMLRYESKYRLAYFLCICACLWHITYGWIILTLSLVYDGALYPERLKDKRIWCVVVANALILSLISIVQWDTFSLKQILFYFFPVMLVIGAQWRFALEHARRMLRFNTIPKTRKLDAEVFLILCTLALVTLCVPIVTMIFGMTLESFFGYTLLPQRLNGLLRVPLLIGGLFLLFRNQRFKTFLGVYSAVFKKLFLTVFFVFIICAYLIAYTSVKTGSMSTITRNLSTKVYESCAGKEELESHFIIYTYMSCRLDNICKQSWEDFFAECGDGRVSLGKN